MPDPKPGKSKWLEWIAIMLAIWVYCLPFLDLGSTTNLPGLESQYFQTFDQILEFTIKAQGQFPLWNPYYSTGIPYMAHPMLHAYNPFVSLPVMLFGTMDGFKIAVFLGFVIAGLGMWWLGKELGLTWVGRIWIGLMYAFSGVPAAKFIQGQYLMVFAFGWIPFSLAAIVAATRSKRWVHICVAAAGLALLFLCGNIYYAYYMLYVIALYTIISAFRLERNPDKPQLDRKDFYILTKTWGVSFICLTAVGLSLLLISGNLYYAYYILFAIALYSLIRVIQHARSPLRLKTNRETLKVLLAIGVLSLGLIAIQLLPALEYRNQYIKDINTELTDSRSIKDVFLDFISPEPFRPGAFSDQLRPEEFYAYVGWWPLIGMLLLPFAWNRQNQRNIVLLLSLVIFTFAWIDVKDMPWRSLFQTIPILYQFRYPSRMIVVGAMALVTAGGLGLDNLWKIVREFKSTEPGKSPYLFDKNLPVIALGIFLIGSICNLALTSRPIIQTSNYEEPRGKIAEWLRKFDSGIYYVDAPNGWDKALIGNQLRYQNGGYAISYLPSFKNQISEREIIAKPKYEILSISDTAQKDSVLVKSFSSVNIYRITDSLPFAFTMTTDVLTTVVNTSLANKEVIPETFVDTNINTLEGVVNSDSNKVLILLSTFTPDWQLTIDGKPTKIYSAYGYMAAEVNPGTHHYVFTYQPVWFFVGLAISVATLVIILIILIADLSKISFGRNASNHPLTPLSKT